MISHRVRQGECFASIAARYGFTDWERVYQHQDNAQHHPDPHVLRPGTLVSIPDREWFSVATSRSHRFKVERTPIRLKLLLQDHTGAAWADKRYSLRVGEQTFEGTTSGAGLLEHAISARETLGELSLWVDSDAPSSITLRLGHLDPHELDTGVQARLNNLEYECGAVDGDLAARTRAALTRFQLRHGLEATGEADEATSAKLDQLARA